MRLGASNYLAEASPNDQRQVSACWHLAGRQTVASSRGMVLTRDVTLAGTAPVCLFCACGMRRKHRNDAAPTKWNTAPLFAVLRTLPVLLTLSFAFSLGSIIVFYAPGVGIEIRPGLQLKPRKRNVGRLTRDKMPYL